MPKKALKKKKAYQAAMRQHAVEGRLPNSNGQMVTNISCAGADTIKQHYFAGYKLGR